MASSSIKKLTIRLHDSEDQDLLAFLQQIPVGQRGTLLRQALRWYFLPGGFHDVVSRLDQLNAALSSGALAALPASDTSVPSPSPPDEDTAQKAMDAMKQAFADMGWGDFP
ncbi:hypothetical protein [Sulfobacillus thermosulfidooxidans]|uniref:hypothetical protein n=1 Tax=Sulfobacillus thermosulfidooxidans TaxID=28034 RepID=UPI0006B4CEAE|nr:hypothetical protein [Sulfobacillus thermosulfidooxidans]